MSIFIITQARFGSSRLKGKVLKEIGDETLLSIHLKRLKKSKMASQVLVATTHEVESSEIVNIAKREGCLFFQGELNDVLSRYYHSALSVGAKVIVRVTSDCPLNDASLIDEMLNEFQASNLDYYSNVHPPTFPDGVDIEIFSFSSLEKAWREATENLDREHVTPYIWRHPELFKLGNLINQTDQSEYRLTVDNQEDYSLIKIIVEKLGINKNWKEYVQFLQEHPELKKLNHHIQRNEGFK